jgi:TnpA family transposase
MRPVNVLVMDPISKIVTASVALKRLVAFSGKNRFFRANRELGRILKTEFILQYLSEPELRD